MYLKEKNTMVQLNWKKNIQKYYLNWDPEAIRWVQKYGTENNDLYYYIRTSQIMIYLICFNIFLLWI